MALPNPPGTRPFRPLLRSFPAPPRLALSAHPEVLLPLPQVAAATDRGRVRRRNEDAVEADAQLGLAVVADGMGGHPAGDVASHLAADQIHAWRSGLDPLPSFLPPQAGSRSPMG